MASETIWLGAVAYDKKVVDIWEGMKDYFHNEAKIPVEIVLFLSYEAQLEQLLAGKIDIGWNTNLAFLQANTLSKGACRPLAMRDTDVGWTTIIITRDGSGIEKPEDLKGKKLALGSRDSGHAAILPVHFLSQMGMKEGTDYETLRFNLDVGKHGDTGTSEHDVFQAVMDGTADAGAVGSPFWATMENSDQNPGGVVKTAWTSPAYNHCMFTAREGFSEEQEKIFTDALYAMDWNNPKHQPILEAEGLQQWIPPKLDDYASLREACEKSGFFDR